ncbi:MAG: MBL fold metallo-hydrolase [Candidatus Thermoplasmatota archaeon]|jgi:phosphoribosyl 1,2-cyclic phosphodiesterase|nr:hypothetical protein [Euryarchaeota archaeon]MED5452095.1 MBL fold metallo-hydrolase [Candidatus Thermoplasmatota archaeon]
MDWFKEVLCRLTRMGMEITHLGSGSAGNSTLLRSEETCVLIDCGFSLKQMEARLGLAGVEPSSIDAILVTHHHSDHSKTALRASKNWDSVLHSNLETATRMGWEPMAECRTFESLERIVVSEEISLMPIPVPHDDADNVAVIASNGDGRRAAIVTDLGELTVDLMRHLSGCSHISIEANYDHSRLMSGPYPESLKRRISGRGGHLSNTQTGDALAEIVSNRLESLVLCHLSERNNAPHLAESEVLMAMEDKFVGSIGISRQSGPEFSHWLGQSEPERIIG